MPEATVKVARDSFPEVGTLPRVPAQEQKKPYIAQARYYIEQRGQTDMRNILIDTVYVTHHKRLESTRPEHRLAARTWTAEQIKEAGAGTILDFIARMLGMNVVGSQVWYRGRMPVFMVDGQIEETIAMLEKPGQEIQYFEDDRYTGELMFILSTIFCRSNRCD